MVLSGYVPTEAQARIHASRARLKCVIGGIRSGKTQSSTADFVWSILRDHAEGKGDPRFKPGPFHKRMRPLLCYWCVSKDWGLLRESITYLRDAWPSEMVLCWLEHEGALWLRLPRGQVLIEFKSAEEPEKLVSRAIHGVLVDEAARVDPVAWPNIRGRLTDFRGWAILDSSPYLGRGNYLYRDFIARKDEDPDVAIFTLRTIDNPIVSVDEIARAKEQMPERYFRRDFLGEWDSWGASCWPEWDPAIHKISERRLMMELGYPGHSLDSIKHTFKGVFVCIDCGYSAPACLLVIVQLSSGEFIVAEEVYESGLLVSAPDAEKRTLVQEAWRLKRKWQIGTSFAFITDTEDKQARAQFDNSGLYTFGANKAIVEGVRKLATLLHVNPATKRPRLRVLDACRNTCDTVPRISWRLDKFGDPVEGEFALGVPLHAADALRYGAQHATRHDDDGVPKRPVTYAVPGGGLRTGMTRG